MRKEREQQQREGDGGCLETHPLDIRTGKNCYRQVEISQDR